jgi:hypothetical protein
MLVAADAITRAETRTRRTITGARLATAWDFESYRRGTHAGVHARLGHSSIMAPPATASAPRMGDTGMVRLVSTVA